MSKLPTKKFDLRRTLNLASYKLVTAPAIWRVQVIRKADAQNPVVLNLNISGLSKRF